jgi:plastocyanin
MIKTTGLLAVVATLALAACGSSNSSSSNSTTSSASSGGGYGSSAKTKTTAASTGGSTVTNGGTIEMQDNAFSPKTITGKPGQTVKLTLNNTGQAEHNFKIDSQLKQANADVKPGAKATVSVTIPKSGTLQFYCEYHKSLGMTGTVKAS